jgi:hypothetical protein
MSAAWVDAATEAQEAAGPHAPGPAAAPLDLHKGIATPEASGCGRWPEHLRLRASDGTAVRARCRATNKCAYCARLFAVETSEMLLLDAAENAPTLLVVLTARELLERRDCRAHLTKLHRACRLRWPAIEWACLVEFQRRGALHLNLLVKGVPADDADQVHEVMSRVWCSRVDAAPIGQSVTPIYAVGGAVKYVSQHFMKPTQAPPEGWQGHRYSATRGYLVRPASIMRQEARESLRFRREVYALDRLLPEGVFFAADEIDQWAREAADRKRELTWELVRVHPTTAAPRPARRVHAKGR